MDNIADNDQSGSDLESSVPVSLVNSSQLQLGTQASVIQSVGGHIIQVFVYLMMCIKLCIETD